MNIEIDGLRELDLKLAALDRKMSGTVMRAALRAACAPMLATMKAMVNKTHGRSTHASCRERPHLYDDLKVRISRSMRLGAYSARVGPSGETAYIAHFQEFGTQPHIIKARRARDLQLLGGRFAKRVAHPGEPARPFMRPAFDTHWRSALEIFKTKLAGML